jgi:hypothetical protein
MQLLGLGVLFVLRQPVARQHGAVSLPPLISQLTSRQADHEYSDIPMNVLNTNVRINKHVPSVNSVLRYEEVLYTKVTLMK